MASAGEVVNHSGRCSASAQPSTVARTARPSASALARLTSTSALAPSLMGDAFPAVTVPPSR